MKQSALVSLTVCTLFALLVGLIPTQVSAQEYAQWETTYLTVKSGHSDALTEELTEHNQAFHASGPYAATVWFVVNVPRSGNLFWVMGPHTFTDLDGRPSGDPHDSDWANDVLAHAEARNTEYWRLNTDLSYTPEGSEAETWPLARIRYFDVTDDALFVKVQTQIKATIEAMGGTRPRLMFQKQFLHRDGRGWAATSYYKNWAELDEEEGNFAEAFQRVHGEAAWATFEEEFDQAVASREDEWTQLVPEMGGATTTEEN